MVKSMTGYGRCEETVGGRRITVELKSVNHKYFEFSPRVTRGYGFLEDKLKTYVQSRVARGKIDLFLSIETLEDADVIVSVNHSLAAGYIAALREITERYKLPDTVTVNSLSRYSDIFSVHKAPEDEEAIWAAVKTVLEKAVDAFIAMRETEGRRLYDDVMSRAAVILELVGKIEARSPETVKEYRERLEAKLREVLSDTTIDEQRILTEGRDLCRQGGRRRGNGPAEKPFRAAQGAAQRRRALRPQDGFPRAGDEPRDEHDRLEGERLADRLYGRRHQGGDRKDPRADPEHRINRKGL